MLLVFDVGNTNIVAAVFEGERLVDSWRMSTGVERTKDEMGLLLRSLIENAGLSITAFEGVIVSSVVPVVTQALEGGIRRALGFSPMIVTNKLRLDIGLAHGVGDEVGADRLVNCVATLKLYGGPAIVIDYGTASKYDVVAEDGTFVTGITSPGIGICAEALFARAALLGRVPLTLPESSLVQNTIESVQMGILGGRIGETAYFVERLKKETGWTDMKVVATGGYVSTLAGGTDIFDVVNENLTLEGLRLIFDMNR